MKKRSRKLSAFLLKQVQPDQMEKGTLQLRQELLSLSMGKKDAVRNYYMKKVQLAGCVLAAGAVLALLVFFAYTLGSKESILLQLTRPGYGENDQKEELNVLAEGESSMKELEITVQSKKYTETEKQTLLALAVKELDRCIQGENLSLDEVSQDLVLPSSLADGVVSLSWTSTPYGIIGEDGTLLKQEEETLVELTGTLSCQGEEISYTAYARVIPPVLSEEEQLLKSIQEEVLAADERDRNTDVLQLPEQVDGKKLTWSRAKENPALTVLGLTLVFALLLWLEMDSQVHQQAQRRKTQLLLDYPDFMWKMTMLLGAGLSIKGTFARISAEYLREKKEQNEKKKEKRKAGKNRKNSGRKNIRYVYEEVNYACYEMESGVSEAQAYERFGKRCQLPEYIRLGFVLSQNLKKGAKGLTDLLEAEAARSLNDRRSHARKIGEQAGTRLLLPMVLMLAVVLAVLMVPAFLTF